MVKHFYHSSTKFFTSLSPNSPVTETFKDSVYLSVPWLLGVYSNPFVNIKDSKLADKAPEDSCIYVYKIPGDRVVRLGDFSRYNNILGWQTTDWATVELIYYYPSWHRVFGINNQIKQLNLNDDIEKLRVM